MLQAKKNSRAPWSKQAALSVVTYSGIALAGLIPMTLTDFHLSGTQIGDLPIGNISTSNSCATCPGDFDSANEPYRTWRGSLMGQAGREAMLTMQPQGTKEQIVSEAARLLRPGGRYGIHELAILPSDLSGRLKSQISDAFARTIHHLVQPLTESGWCELLQRHGMEVRTVRTAPMHLLEPRRVIRDEGFFGALRFFFNVLRNCEARSRVLRLRRLFRDYRDNVGAIMLVAVKK
jgi:hypothetical protein